MTFEERDEVVALLREAATALCVAAPSLAKRLDQRAARLVLRDITSGRDDRRDHDRHPPRPL